MLLVLWITSWCPTIKNVEESVNRVGRWYRWWLMEQWWCRYGNGNGAISLNNKITSISLVFVRRSFFSSFFFHRHLMPTFKFILLRVLSLSLKIIYLLTQVFSTPFDPRVLQVTPLYRLSKQSKDIQRLNKLKGIRL